MAKVAAKEANMAEEANTGEEAKETKAAKEAITAEEAKETKAAKEAKTAKNLIRRSHGRWQNQRRQRCR